MFSCLLFFCCAFWTSLTLLSHDRLWKTNEKLLKRHYLFILCKGYFLISSVTTTG
uniref:Uncharacterized protein n=1 Tax=Arundo donax TaxID=35708 RepID=A0A0A9E5R2_ARUDO